MSAGTSITAFSLDRPRTITTAMVVVALTLGALAALPSIWPGTFPALHALKVDTDPENMLPEDEPVRVYHNAMKEEMSLSDIVVLGVVNRKHPNGVFNADSLNRIYDLTEFAKDLTWREGPDNDLVGVKQIDLIAPSTVDIIEILTPGSAGVPGTIDFRPLMKHRLDNDAQARDVRRRAANIPFFHDTLISGDNEAVCLYLPLTSKDISYKVASKLNDKVAELGGDDDYHITGLPVAEDTFGVEMFKQMAISAPVAMLVIFLLMLVFFRKIVLIVSPMIVAVVSIICTMGLLVITGNTVHIMSSMIPIFIMPIAVLDAVHILSDFFDRYQETKDRKKTITHVMATLFTPMLYTSLTTAVGFASLALTPIPPVQVFGLFIAFGVMVAWVLTVTFIPAFVMFIPEKSLASFGATHHGDDAGPKTFLSRMLARLGLTTYRRARVILILVLVLVALAVFGITRIEVNDNPVKWFTASHPIRVADRTLNAHFGGTYMAYLALEPSDAAWDAPTYVREMLGRLKVKADALKADDYDDADAAFSGLKAEAQRLAATGLTKTALLKALEKFAAGKSVDGFDAWNELSLAMSAEGQRDQIFKQPEILKHVEDLQAHLQGITSTDGRKLVGKSNSVVDIVKTVHRDLFSGAAKDYRIPATAPMVANCLTQFESAKPQDGLWHFVTPSYRKTVLWVQLKSGDNRDMEAVKQALDKYIEQNPLPAGLEHRWFGLTYINVVWQQKMVAGMLKAFLGSFLAVFLMMTLLYRSALWGLLCMIPLTVTIGLIYGVIGLVGKDYDMPVAVLSSLSLGLAVDYAIHFLSRSRGLYAKHGSWQATAGPVFGEPARAIARNVIVVGVGFLPLIFATLIPYKTVGVLIAAILVAAGVATLFILPAVIALVEKLLFPQTKGMRLTCKCGTCALTAIATVALIVVNVHRFLTVGSTTLTWISIAAVLALMGLCAVTSRREACKTRVEAEKTV